MAGTLDAYVNDIIRDATLQGQPTVGLALDALNFSATKVHRATLVRIAEAAVDYARPADAQRALDEFFARHPVHDQHYVRALYASAELQALRAAAFGGHNRLQLVLAAIDTLLRGLAIAEKGGSAGDTASYRFLVYNASVHHWNIVQPLLRLGYRRHATASLVRIVDALGLAEDPDLPWRVRHHLMIANCSAETAAEERGGSGAGDALRAMQAALSAAWDLACRAARAAPLDPALARLVEDVVRLAAHLSIAAPSAATHGGGKDKGEGAGSASATAGDAPPLSASSGKGAKGAASGGSSVFTSAQLSGSLPLLANADPRSKVTAALQALWTATAIGCDSCEAPDAELAALDPASLLTRARRMRGSADVRARLLDLLQVRGP